MRDYRILVRNRSGRIVSARGITAADDQEACRIAARIPEPGDQAAIWDQSRRVGLVNASRTSSPAHRFMSGFAAAMPRL